MAVISNPNFKQSNQFESFLSYINKGDSDNLNTNDLTDRKKIFIPQNETNQDYSDNNKLQITSGLSLIAKKLDVMIRLGQETLLHFKQAMPVDQQMVELQEKKYLFDTMRQMRAESIQDRKSLTEVISNTSKYQEVASKLGIDSNDKLQKEIHRFRNEFGDKFENYIGESENLHKQSILIQQERARNLLKEEERGKSLLDTLRLQVKQNKQIIEEDIRTGKRKVGAYGLEVGGKGLGIGLAGAIGMGTGSSIAGSLGMSSLALNPMISIPLVLGLMAGGGIGKNLMNRVKMSDFWGKYQNKTINKMMKGESLSSIYAGRIEEKKGEILEQTVKKLGIPYGSLKQITTPAIRTQNYQMLTPQEKMIALTERLVDIGRDHLGFTIGIAHSLGAKNPFTNFKINQLTFLDRMSAFFETIPILGDLFGGKGAMGVAGGLGLLAGLPAIAGVSPLALLGPLLSGITGTTGSMAGAMTSGITAGLGDDLISTILGGLIDTTALGGIGLAGLMGYKGIKWGANKLFGKTEMSDEDVKKKSGLFQSNQDKIAVAQMETPNLLLDISNILGNIYNINLDMFQQQGGAISEQQRMRADELSMNKKFDFLTGKVMTEDQYSKESSRRKELLRNISKKGSFFGLFRKNKVDEQTQNLMDELEGGIKHKFIQDQIQKEAEFQDVGGFLKSISSRSSKKSRQQHSAKNTLINSGLLFEKSNDIDEAVNSRSQRLQRFKKSNDIDEADDSRFQRFKNTSKEFGSDMLFRGKNFYEKSKPSVKKFGGKIKDLAISKFNTGKELGSELLPFGKDIYERSKTNSKMIGGMIKDLSILGFTAGKILGIDFMQRMKDSKFNIQTKSKMLEFYNYVQSVPQEILVQNKGKFTSAWKKIVSSANDNFDSVTINSMLFGMKSHDKFQDVYQGFTNKFFTTLQYINNYTKEITDKLLNDQENYNDFPDLTNMLKGGITNVMGEPPKPAYAKAAADGGKFNLQENEWLINSEIVPGSFELINRKGSSYSVQNNSDSKVTLKSLFGNIVDNMTTAINRSVLGKMTGKMINKKIGTNNVNSRLQQMETDRLAKLNEMNDDRTAENTYEIAEYAEEQTTVLQQILKRLENFEMNDSTKKNKPGLFDSLLKGAGILGKGGILGLIAYGIYDLITDVTKNAIEGFKNDGFIGGILGGITGLFQTGEKGSMLGALGTVGKYAAMGAGIGLIGGPVGWLGGALIGGAIGGGLELINNFIGFDKIKGFTDSIRNSELFIGATDIIFGTTEKIIDIISIPSKLFMKTVGYLFDEKNRNELFSNIQGIYSDLKDKFFKIIDFLTYPGKTFFNFMMNTNWNKMLYDQIIKIMPDFALPYLNKIWNPNRTEDVNKIISKGYDKQRAEHYLGLNKETIEQKATSNLATEQEKSFYNDITSLKGMNSTDLANYIIDTHNKVQNASSTEEKDFLMRKLDISSKLYEQSSGSNLKKIDTVVPKDVQEISKPVMLIPKTDGIIIPGAMSSDIIPKFEGGGNVGAGQPVIAGEKGKETFVSNDKMNSSIRRILDFKLSNGNTLEQFIKGNEGLALEKYPDAGGYSIGYGHFIKPGENYFKITKDEADSLFVRDFEDHFMAASKIPGFENVSPNQKAGLIDMTYNMGANWWKKFPGAIDNLVKNDIPSVIKELKDSKWYGQVKNRADKVLDLFDPNSEDNIAKKFELLVKGGMNGQAFAGGDTHPGILELAKQIQLKIQDKIKYFSAFNDQYHAGTNSKHASGLALDLVVKDQNDSGSVADMIRNIGKEIGANIKVIDEYKNPSARSTAGHIHAQFDNNEIADKFKSMANNVMNGITGGISSAKEGITDTYNNFTSGQYDSTINQGMENVKDFAGKGYELTKDATIAGYNTVKDFANSEGVQNSLGSAMELGKSTLSALFKEIDAGEKWLMDKGGATEYNSMMNQKIRNIDPNFDRNVSDTMSKFVGKSNIDYRTNNSGSGSGNLNNLNTVRSPMSSGNIPMLDSISGELDNFKGMINDSSKRISTQAKDLMNLPEELVSNIGKGSDMRMHNVDKMREQTTLNMQTQQEQFTNSNQAPVSPISGQSTHSSISNVNQNNSELMNNMVTPEIFTLFTMMDEEFLRRMESYAFGTHPLPMLDTKYA